MTKTLENMQVTMGDMQGTIGSIQNTIENMQVTIGGIQGTMGGMQGTIGNIQVTMGDMQANYVSLQESVDFLVENAVMRVDVRQIVREEIAPVESRLISVMERFMGDHKTVKEEVLAHDYRIRRLEVAVGIRTSV